MTTLLILAHHFPPLGGAGSQRWLKREIVACLRTGRALRVPRARTQARGKKFVSPEVMISERPAEADDRAVPGHWEGDLILGLESSAIGTLVERMTRFTILLHLPRMEDHGDQPRAKNGPALTGHGAEGVRDAIAASIITLPVQLRRSLVWDQGAEMAQHAQLRIDTGLRDTAPTTSPQSPPLSTADPARPSTELRVLRRLRESREGHSSPNGEVSAGFCRRLLALSLGLRLP